MELTGQCKDEFEKWYKENYHKSLIREDVFQMYLIVFYNRPTKKKMGVFEDYLKTL
jgi:hypothetical protein